MSTKIWKKEENDIQVKYFKLPEQTINLKKDEIKEENIDNQYIMILNNFLDDMSIMGIKKDSYFNDEDPTTLLSLEDINKELLFTFEEDGKYFAFSTETIKDIYKSNNYVNPITNKSMEHLKERIEKVGKIVDELFPVKKDILEISETNLLKLYTQILTITKKCDIPIQSKWIVNLSLSDFSKFINELKLYISNNNNDLKNYMNKTKFYNSKYNDVLIFKWEFALFLKDIFEYTQKNNNQQILIYILIASLNHVSRDCKLTYQDIV